MKNSYEIYQNEVEKFSISLRKSKRYDFAMKRRNLISNQIQAERKKIFETLLEYLSQSGCKPSKLIFEMKDDDLELILKEMMDSSDCFQVDHYSVLDFFYCLSKSPEECELILKFNLLEPLIDIIGISVNSTEILQLFLEIIDTYPDAALELIHLGLIEQIKSFLQVSPKALEICSYLIYRLVCLSGDNLDWPTINIIVRFCKWQLSTGNESIKLHVYHTINFILQKRNSEVLCKFVCKKVVSDIKIDKFQRIILEISINITTGDNQIAKKLVRYGVLDCLDYLAENRGNFTDKVVHLLGNLIDSSGNLKSIIITHQIYKKISGLVDSPSFEVRKQVSYFYHHLSNCANYMQLNLCLDFQLFLRINDVFESSLEISRNYLDFFYNILKKKMYLEKVRKAFDESGCLEKIEKFAISEHFCLKSAQVLKKFEKYFG
jgi:hypothetical protein